MYVSLSISSILAKALKIIHLLVTMLAAGSTGFWPRCSTVPFHVKRVGQHRLLPGTVFIINTILHRPGVCAGPHPAHNPGKQGLLKERKKIMKRSPMVIRDQRDTTKQLLPMFNPAMIH